MSRYNDKKFYSHPQICEYENWPENRICRLVCLYRKFPCLWKKDNPSYMDNSMRHSAYSNIHRGMETPDITFTEVMIKIREVRRIYVEELQKILKARDSGHRYEPKQKWFFTLHNFLYEHLDFDEAAELRSPEDSTASCQQEYDDEDLDDSEVVDVGTIARNFCNSSPSFDGAKSRTWKKILQRISCDSSEAGSSTNEYLTRQTNPKRSPFIGVNSSLPKANYCPIKIIHCPQHDSDPDREVCQRAPRSKKSTSVTIICNKKINPTIGRDEIDGDANWKCFSSTEKDSSSPSCAKSSSIERLDSNGSLNTWRDKIGDEFDVFAKSVACQLRKMDLESAVTAQNQIQNILTDQRLRKNPEVKPETEEPKDLDIVDESPSPQQSATRVKSKAIKSTNSTPKRQLYTAKPNSRKQEFRIVQQAARGSITRRQLSPVEKTKKSLSK